MQDRELWSLLLSMLNIMIIILAIPMPAPIITHQYGEDSTGGGVLFGFMDGQTITGVISVHGGDIPIIGLVPGGVITQATTVTPDIMAILVIPDVTVILSPNQN